MKRRPRILIVDDSDELRELLRRTVGSDDIEIFEASDGPSAVATARKHVPDLIFMDILMPGEFDGFEACRRIKADEKTASCCVVFLSGRAGRRDIEEGGKAGGDSFLIKPFSPIELIRKVDEFIER